MGHVEDFIIKREVVKDKHAGEKDLLQETKDNFRLHMLCVLNEISLINKTQKVRLRWSCRASLVAQWLRICLLMQGTRVRALVWEDPTCHGAAGPVSHNC